MAKDAQGNEKKALVGHLGTHFDVMNKEFPLEYTKRKAVVFDVSHVLPREITVSDIDSGKVQKDMFVAFYTGFLEKEGYGGKIYFSEHPQLSVELVDFLLDRGVSIIGIDSAGVRRGKEHTAIDQYCADRDAFIVENLCNLQDVLRISDTFTANTYPMNYAEMTGLPCRVIAQVE